MYPSWLGLSNQTLFHDNWYSCFFFSSCHNAHQNFPLVKPHPEYGNCTTVFVLSMFHPPCRHLDGKKNQRKKLKCLNSKLSLKSRAIGIDLVGIPVGCIVGFLVGILVGLGICSTSRYRRRSYRRFHSSIITLCWLRFLYGLRYLFGGFRIGLLHYHVIEIARR